MSSIGTPLMWWLFAAFVVLALVVDFIALNKQGAHKVSMREAFVWSLIWVGVSAAFAGWLWWYLGSSPDEATRALANTKLLEFTTGYLVEKALAVDNVFVFLMVFTYFSVPAEYQKRVLMFGILGAIVLTSNVFAILGLRALYFLLAGMHERFHLLSYGLAVVLLFIGTKMLLIDVYKISVGISLGVTAVILAASMILSQWIPAGAKQGTAYPFARKKSETPPDSA